MRRSILSVFVISFAGCLAVAPSPPEPVSLRSSQPPRDAVRSAAVALVTAGFQVTQTDSLGGAVAGVRTSAANGNEAFVTCQLPRNSGAASNRATSLRIVFTAKPAERGSDIVIQSTVTTTYPGYDGTPMAMAANERDCISNGTMERRLADALR